jgi:hypothetical protein
MKLLQVRYDLRRNDLLQLDRLDVQPLPLAVDDPDATLYQ